MTGMNVVRVMPVDGRRCYNEQGLVIPDTGLEVVLNTYWNRRIKDGDVLIADPDSESSNELTLKSKQEDDNDDT